MEPAVRMVLLDALSAMAAEVTAAWDGGLVGVRVRGGDPEVVVVPDAPHPAGDDALPATEDGTARISLRLPEPLEVRAEQAAAARGTSLNTWLVRAVAAAPHTPGSTPSGRGLRRLSGFARS